MCNDPNRAHHHGPRFHARGKIPSHAHYRSHALCAVSPEVNKAKCWAIPALIFSIISCIGFLGGAWLQGIGGICGIVAASVLICCGPRAMAEGDGKLTAAFVLFIIATATEIIGAILGVILFLQAEARIRNTCVFQHANTASAGYTTCYNLLIGLTATFIWPAVIIGGVAGVFCLLATIFSWQARAAVKKQIAGGGVAQGAKV